MSEEIAECAREKYWEESNADEKIERAREQIKSLKIQVEDLIEIIDQLTKHSHVGGKMIIPFDNQRQKSERAYRRGRGDKEVYF